MKRILVLLVMLVFFVLPVMAQDETPTPEPFATNTAVMVVEPVQTDPAPVATSTAIPENPRGGIQWADLAPYAFAVLAIGALGLFGVAGLGMILLFKSQPISRTVAPVLVPPAGDAVVGAYEGFAKLTKPTWDDELAKQLRAEWEAWKTRFLEELRSGVSVGVDVADSNGASEYTWKGFTPSKYPDEETMKG